MDSHLFDAMDSQGHGAVCVRSLPWLLLNVWKNRNSILYAATQESPTFWVSNVEEEAKIWEKVNKKSPKHEGSGFYVRRS